MDQTKALNALHGYADRLDAHIQTAAELTEGLRHIRYVIEEIRHQPCLKEISSLKEEIDILKEQLQQAGLPRLDVYNYRFGVCEKMLAGEDWPEAVDPTIIFRNEEEERERADRILTLLVADHMEGKKFLDFGCGLGYTTKQAHEKGAAISVGYDPAKEWKFEPHEGVILTEKLDVVKANAPYDVVLIFDVLDHCLDPVKELAFVREYLSGRGKVYLRTHPWCSRHGAHLYEQLNKAFIHLVFDEIELTRIGGIHSGFNQKVLYPETTYEKWIEKAGMNILSKVVNDEAVEPFFLDPFQNMAIRDRLVAKWKGEDPNPHMCISFIDYVLEPSQSNTHIF